MIEILSITLRTLNYGNYGIFLLMGHAGFISSTVVPLTRVPVYQGAIFLFGGPALRELLM